MSVAIPQTTFQASTVSRPPDIGVLRGTVRSAFAHLMVKRPELTGKVDSEPWLERAATVLAHNIASGRFIRACRDEGDASSVLSEYAQKVLTGLLSEWEMVEALRLGDSRRWTATLKRLERRAYSWLGPMGRTEWATWEAREAAAKTCADLWSWLQDNSFPFDVSFDDWSERALLNRLHQAARADRVHTRYVVDSLDRPVFDSDLTYGDLLGRSDLEAWLARTGEREVLSQALAHLNTRQAQVIRLWYLDGWPAEEIAAEMGMTVDYIYVLKHRALHKLQRCYEPRSRADKARPASPAALRSRNPSAPRRPQ